MAVLANNSGGFLLGYMFQPTAAWHWAANTVADSPLVCMVRVSTLLKVLGTVSAKFVGAVTAAGCMSLLGVAL